MEVKAAEAAVSFAVETLGKMLIEKAQFLIGVEEDVKWLQKELKSIKCFMKDAAKKQSDDESIRNWISDIREVAHDAEDAIETFVLKVQSKSLNKKYGCFPNHLYHLNKVGEQIKSIRQTLVDIQDRRVRYKFENDGSGDQKAEPSSRTRSRAEEIEARRRLAYWKPDQQVVGLEGDVKLLLREAVLKESEGPLVAAIVGMGGMGKSTLASKIYNHPEVVGGFDFRAWAVVSSEFTPEDIMKQMLQQLGISADELKLLESVSDNRRRQEDLKKKLHQCLTGKRYFIVLDDVWEDKHWQSLSTAFPQEDKGSRLLLTSRNHVITRHDGYVHDMKPLGKSESWDLFMRKAFGGNTSSIHGCPEELKKVGEEILKKCGGLPLAISVVGGLLAKKTRSKSEWERVHKEMESHLDRSSGDLDNIFGILELSYHNLTPELKACFLCLGFFRDDAIIKAERLVRIWVAQGLVAQREDPVEDVARDYLNELVTRNMVQVKEMEYDHQVRSCQMHDLVRDLSIRKAREEMDFEVVREGGNSHPLSNKPRHRAIYCRDPTFIYSTDRNQYLRSLFVYPGWSIISGGPSSYWKSFELLRVLDFERTTFEVFPKAIGELTGLRYLKMRYTGLGGESRLPLSWAKLKNLEVLDIRSYYSRPVTIDKVITKMLSLRHLYADVSSCKVGLGNMRNLRTLDMFTMMRSSDVRKIQGMSGVSRLGIRLRSAGETNSLFTCLSSLDNLSRLNLYIVWSFSDLEGLTSLHRVTRLKFSGSDVAVPVYLPPNLSHLTVKQSRLEEHSMAALEKLPNLLYLNLKDMIKPDGVTEITVSGFPKLKVLRLRNIKYAYKLEIKESAMPELNQLIVFNCPNLEFENVPERIKSAIIVETH